MESQANFLWYLAILSGRSLLLAGLAWLALRVFRIKSASAKHAVWSVVTAVMIGQVFASSALPALSVRILAPVDEGAPAAAPPISPPIPVAAGDFRSRGLVLPSWSQLAVGLYVTVALTLLIRLIWGYFLARRLVRSSKPVDKLGVRESEWISVPVTL